MNKRLEVIVAGGVGQDTVLLKRIAEVAGGYTVTPSFGGWIDDAGVLVQEQSSSIVVYADSVSTLNLVRGVVLHAAALAGEDAVLFSASAVDAEIVDTGVRKGEA